MADPIKAIETRYNGHRFRSRTEARWAVLFDHLGVKYEYEPEGYDVGEGKHYLPDFWLPVERCFVEVKGDSAAEHDWRKVALLVLKTGLPVYVLMGQPGYHSVVLIKPKSQSLTDPQLIEDWLEQAPTAKISLIAEAALESHYIRCSGAKRMVDWEGLLFSGRSFVDLDYCEQTSRLAHWLVDMIASGPTVVRDKQTGAWCYSHDIDKYVAFAAIGDEDGEELRDGDVRRSTRFQRAIDAARSARFEFGESGAG